MSNTNNTPHELERLSPKEELFCIKYLEIGNIGNAVIEAGYKSKDIVSASATGNRLLKKNKIQKKIKELKAEMYSDSIADAKEVMEYFTRVMRGEEKDQFDLDAPLSERTKAALELAKRTVDVEARAQGKADNVVKIELDWNMED